MSIELYCSRFLHQDAAAFPSTALEDALAEVNAKLDNTRSKLVTNDGSALCERLSIQGTERGAWSLTFERPSGQEALLRLLLALLRLEGVVLYAPDSPLMVGHARTTAHIPAGMLAALGPPWTVCTPSAIASSLFGSGLPGAA